jgi:polysaccharide pyruvyl transferase WcaK-like protein
MITQKDRRSLEETSPIVNAESPAAASCQSDGGLSQPVIRIALLTPYSGNNLGDAAIQDAMIANIRLRFPSAHFSGLSLNCDNFVERHGEDAFPLTRHAQRLNGISVVQRAKQSADGTSSSTTPDATVRRFAPPTSLFRRIPLVGPYLVRIKACGRTAWQEFRHSLEAFKFLRGQDLLIVSGGGQLDDEWGGAWGHPLALFKWALLARLAGVPFAIVSVGAGKLRSTATRLFLSSALRMAQYRSYREEHSRELATGLLRHAAQDPVVPDLAFSLPPSELPQPMGIRSFAQGRMIVAISPIAYARPKSWPYQDKALYERYIQQIVSVITELIRRGYFVVIVWSSITDGKTAVPDILHRLDDLVPQHLPTQLHIPTITTWKDLVAVLQDVDFLVASRLHSAILGILVRRPTIAISFDRKVDWLMEDLGHADYLLHIDTFTAVELLGTLDRLKLHTQNVCERINSYQQHTAGLYESQYDTITEVIMTHPSSRPSRNSRHIIPSQPRFRGTADAPPDR